TRFQQHLGGKHHLLARVRQHVGYFQPVGEPQFVTSRTDRFPQVDDVHWPFTDRFIELQRRDARPVVLQRPKSDLHGFLILPVRRPTSRAGDSRSASAAVLRRLWPAPPTRTDALSSVLRSPAPGRSPGARRG